MRKNLALKIICFVAFFSVLGACCSIPFYFESPSMFYKFGLAKLLLRWGKIFGIIAGFFLVFQPVLVARIFFLDRIFGQDRLLRLHRTCALVLTGAAFLHPVFILWAENFTLYPLETRYWAEFLGLGLVLLILLTTMISVFRTALHISWNGWFSVHRVLAPIILITFFVHVLNVSKSFASGLPNRVLLFAAVLTLCVVAAKWALKTGPGKKKYRVAAVKPAAKDAWSVDVTPLSGQDFSYLPGQFAYITPIGEKIAREEHPFTIASSPLKAGGLQFVIRSCGDFTARIKDLVPGDFFLVDGPYGRFSHVLVDETPVVMIAGGIGITPMLSMLRFMSRSGDEREVLLIWSNKTRDHIIFKEEFSEFSKTLPHLFIHHVLTRETTGSKTGHRISAENLNPILRGCDRNATVFLCGPPAMVVTAKQLLKRSGFSCSRVYTESFVL